jgi:hypothetical protein
VELVSVGVRGAWKWDKSFVGKLVVNLLSISPQNSQKNTTHVFFVLSP